MFGTDDRSIGNFQLHTASFYHVLVMHRFLYGQPDLEVGEGGIELVLR